MKRTAAQTYILNPVKAGDGTDSTTLKSSSLESHICVK